MNLSNALSNLTILYLEDDEEVRVNITNTLSNFVKKVYAVESAKKAFIQYYKNKPDIIITDIDMKDINGLEFLKEIRIDDPFIPTIVITAYKNEQFLLDAISLQLEDYIVKPISYVNLKKSLEKCVHKLSILNRLQISFSTGYKYDIHNNTMIDDQNNIVKLQNKEKLLLQTLLEYQNDIEYYHSIEENVWEGEELNKGTLKALIGKLRQKIGKDSIVNESEMGYRLIV